MIPPPKKKQKNNKREGKFKKTKPLVHVIIQNFRNKN